MSEDTDISRLTALRCTSCGAPLSEGPAGTEYIKCVYCGTVQRTADINRYIESFRGELYSWLKDLVPATSTGTASMDPVARHNIFVYNVKPRIMAEYVSVKSRLTMLLSRGMLYPPFYRPQGPGPQDTSKKAFERLAGIESVKDLAVNDEDKAFIHDAVATYTLYSYVLLMADLIARRENIELLDNSFRNILKALENDPRRKVEYSRISGLYSGYRALDRFASGDVPGAITFTDDSLKKLEETLALTNAAPLYRPATLSEISALKALKRLEETGMRLSGAGKSPIEYMPALEKFMRLAERYNVERKLLTDELVDSWCRAVEAKNGLCTVDATGTAADVLIPFWEVSLTYTFKTGAILWSKGVKVDDKLMVAATYPMADAAVTDIFQAGNGADLMDRLSGKETTMTGSGVVRLLKNVAPNRVPSGIPLFPPIVTNEMAEAVANNYLAGVSARSGGKVTLGAAKAERLVYLPASARDGRLTFPDLGAYSVNLDRFIKDILDASV